MVQIIFFSTYRTEQAINQKLILIKDSLLQIAMRIKSSFHPLPPINNGMIKS